VTEPETEPYLPVELGYVKIVDNNGSFSLSALFSASFVSAFSDVSGAAPGATDTSPCGFRLHDDSDVISSYYQ